MTKGRRPEPAAVQAAKGNPGKRKRVAPSDTLPVGAVTPASGLSQAALRIWKHLAPELERLRFLRPSDSQAFSRYCEAVVRYWDVTARLKGIGETYETESLHGKMLRIHPLFVVQERLARRLIDLEDRFGLSPAARQQIMLKLANQQPSLPLGGQSDAAPAPEPAHMQENPVGWLNQGAKIH